MKKSINDIFNQIEDWESEDLERLQSEIESLLMQRIDDYSEGKRDNI